MPLPTVILPGYLAPARDYVALEKFLISQGYSTVTVPLTRRDWWITVGGRPVTPILEQLDQTIRQVLTQTGAEQVNLVGHSAGGWIARIYLGDVPYCDRVWAGRSKVKTLISLGTPHSSQERWTRTNLDFVNQSYPKAFHPDVQYVCVAGKASYGVPSWRLRQWFTYQSYQLTSGRGDCWGDGITPVDSAHLDGATNLTLDQVQHSPRSRQAGQYQWYGSENAVLQWMPYLQ